MTLDTLYHYSIPFAVIVTDWAGLEDWSVVVSVENARKHRLKVDLYIQDWEEDPRYKELRYLKLTKEDRRQIADFINRGTLELVKKCAGGCVYEGTLPLSAEFKKKLCQITGRVKTYSKESAYWKKMQENRRKDTITVMEQKKLGKTHQEIAQMIGRSVSHVDRISYQNKLHEHIKPETIKKVKQLKREGWFLKDIAKELKISLASAHKYSHK